MSSLSLSVFCTSNVCVGVACVLVTVLLWWRRWLTSHLCPSAALSSSREFVTSLVALGDIAIDGPADTDLQVRDERVYVQAVRDGIIGVGEAYMDGWWDAESLDGIIYKVLRSRIDERAAHEGWGFRWQLIKAAVLSRVINMQSKERSLIVGKVHYDIDLDLYRPMLGPSMVYTCGFWRFARNLTEAQYHKMRLICEKANLKPGMKVLDVGCGWGAFAKFAAENYGVSVVGITISQNQLDECKRACSHLNSVEFRFCDYRDMNDKFDRIISIGMFEAVGYQNYRSFFEMLDRCLSSDGLAVLHTMGRHSKMVSGGWITKYIFPNGDVPTLGELNTAMFELFVVEDIENIGSDYDLTLMEWYKNFNKAYSDLDHIKYDERFKRMWNFYLCSFAAWFRSRTGQLWQLVLSRGVDGFEGAYRRPLMSEIKWDRH
jgi:cyclopropane-fatty-acyl-phospholipid synthase